MIIGVPLELPEGVLVDHGQVILAEDADLRGAPAHQVMIIFGSVVADDRPEDDHDFVRRFTRNIGVFCKETWP